MNWTFHWPLLFLMTAAVDETLNKSLSIKRDDAYEIPICRAQSAFRHMNLSVRENSAESPGEIPVSTTRFR